MGLLPPGLLQGLARSRLLPRIAQATSGVGERVSRIKGPGVEFEDYRTYQPGDNMRHIDHNVYLRTGRHYVREYASYRQLDVQVLLDVSGSMNHGDSRKLQFARAVAVGLSFVALAGGDRVQVGTLGSDVRWFDAVQGAQRLPLIEARLSVADSRGDCASLEEALAGSLHRVTPGSIQFLVSDFMMDGVPGALKRLAGRGSEPVAIHVLAPEEEDPRLLDSAASLLIDSEAGDSINLSLGKSTFERYAAELHSWREELRASVGAAGGRYFQVSTTANLNDLFLRQWRLAGLIG